VAFGKTGFRKLYEFSLGRGEGYGEKVHILLFTYQTAHTYQLIKAFLACSAEVKWRQRGAKIPLSKDKEKSSHHAQQKFHRITESQHGRGWQGPLWVTQSKPLPKQGHPEQAA